MRWLLPFILAVITLQGMAQEVFHVIHVSGQILLESTGEPIKRGDKIQADAKIQFKSAGAMAAVVSSTRGRLVIRPNPTAKTETELSGFLKDIVEAGSGKLSTRGALINLLDLQNHFSGDYLVVGERSAVPIDPGSFPINADRFFYVRYTFKDELINKKLSSSGDSLVLDASEIFVVDGEPIDRDQTGSMELFYYNSVSQESQKIGSFTAFFPTNDEILPGVRTLSQMLEEDGKSKSEIIDETEALLMDLYGKVYRPNLENWMGSVLFK